MDEEVEQKSISDFQIEVINKNLDGRRDYPEDEIEHTQIKFILL